MADEYDVIKRFAAIPRQMFDEFSAIYGNGSAGEVDVSEEFTPRLFRPLPKLGFLKGSDDKKIPAGALCLYTDSHQRKDGTSCQRLEFLPYMPYSEETFDSGGMLGVRPRLILYANVEHMDAYTPQLRFYASWSTGHGSSSFPFIGDRRRYWPVVREMIERFYVLTEPFPESIDMKEAVPA